MARQSILEYFQAESRPGSEVAVAWRRGYRMIRWSHAELLGAAHHFARNLETRGIGKGDRVLIWGQNSGEWLAAFLGCLFAGAVAVPMDAIADKGFAARVARQAGVRLAVIGRELAEGASSDLGVPIVALESLGSAASRHPSGELPAAEIRRNDPIEIVFTSGTTSEPRGVVLTHGNLLANLETFEKEIDRYRRWERFFHPLRFLDLLPLSHVFGQLLGIFLPQILGGTSVFLDTLNPGEVIRAIHDERVSVLVTVPRLVESLQDQIERDLEAQGRLEQFRRDFEKADGEHFLRRWWRFRAIHRRFGWKFWAVISGGAALPAAAEKFWGRLGYAAVQGYGLTETTSLVSVNHPFRLGQGSIGKTMPALEVKLSESGEILVRGENVASGYWKESGVATVLDADGWFHTGDLGERDAEGNLYFKGRQKNVIVTPEGLNIFPEDLEAELRKDAGVRDCVVVGIERDGNAEPCAALLLREGTSAPEIVQRANSQLAPFQQMRRWVIWRDPDFPRTPTQKPVLARIRERVAAELGERPPAAGGGAGTTAPSAMADLLQKISHGAAGVGGDLQLSSIERVELMSALEDRYQVDLSEAEFSSAHSVADLENLVARAERTDTGANKADGGKRETVFRYSRWPRWRPVRWIRALAFYCLVRPAMLLLGWPRVRGRENLRGVAGPVLIVSNHITYIDPGFVLTALPPRLRWRTAVAMGGERLAALRNPPPGTGFFRGLLGRVQYPLLLAIFHVFPLPMRGGFRKSFAFAGELVDRGWSVLVFPEGELTPDGAIAPFRAGIGLLATRLGIPVVPVWLDGLFELREANKHWTSFGHIRVAVGAPVAFPATAEPEEIARELERRVRELENCNS
ncbi:MAG: AMP-binding protein [Candidatus Acidiferrales bacterium]